MSLRQLLNKHLQDQDVKCVLKESTNGTFGFCGGTFVRILMESVGWFCVRNKMTFRTSFRKYVLNVVKTQSLKNLSSMYF